MKPPISGLSHLLLYTFSNLVQGQSNVLLNPKCIIQAHIGNDIQNGSFHKEWIDESKKKPSLFKELRLNNSNLDIDKLTKEIFNSLE